MSVSIILMGLFVGVLVGLMGVGGVVLLIFFLIVFGINFFIVVGMDFVYNLIIKLFGVVFYWWQKMINFKLVKYLVIGSILSVFLVIGILYLFFVFYQYQEEIIKYVFGYVLILVVILIIVCLFLDRKLCLNCWQLMLFENKWVLMIFIGIVFGFIVGLILIGLGLLFVIVMIYLFNMKVLQIVGIDIVYVFFFVMVVGILNVSFGSVDYMLVVNLLFGLIFGVLIGSYFLF